MEDKKFIKFDPTNVIKMKFKSKIKGKYAASKLKESETEHSEEILPQRTTYANNYFSSEPTIQDLDFDHLNSEVRVRVRWIDKKVYRFKIRKYQSFESMYEFFSKKEAIDNGHILLYINKKRLSPSDNPNSITYTSEIIVGEIGYLPAINIGQLPVEDEVKFRINRDGKRSVFMYIKKTDKMVVLYIKLSEKLNLQLKNFTLLFDCESVKYSDTMETLDLEGDECFDLIQTL